MVSPYRHRHDTEAVECVECDAVFDLARQSYYGPVCPSCRGE